MTTLLEAPTASATTSTFKTSKNSSAPHSSVSATVRDVAHSLISVIESSKSMTPPGLNVAFIPTKSRLDSREVKCVNHLVCALVLAQPEVALEAQSSAFNRHKVLELLS